MTTGKMCRITEAMRSPTEVEHIEHSTPLVIHCKFIAKPSRATALLNCFL